jgi:flagellar hook-basal body complex protein FliE
MPLPIPPIGGEFSLPSLTGAAPASSPGSGGGGFAKALADQIGKLDASQADAAQQAQQLATGKAEDISSVVLSVQKASLEIQLATQVRNKLVEAYQEIFRMQV